MFFRFLRKVQKNLTVVKSYVTFLRLFVDGQPAPGALDVIIDVKLKPGAKKSRVEAFDDGTLKVSVKQPPVEGKANRALIDLLADFFNVAKGCIEIKKGARSRIKRVEIGCLDDEKIMHVLRRLEE